MSKKKINGEDDLDFIPDNNKRPLTSEELTKIELKKRVKELREKSKDQVQVIVTLAGEVKRADTLTLQEQADEYTRCGMNPIYFIETYLTVFDQTRGESGEIVPFKLFEFQKLLIKSYLKNKQNIANKYRQAGVSTTTCAYIAWYVMFNENRYAAVVADKLETARDELLSDIIEFIECCPAYLKPLVASKDTAHHKKYKNNSQIKAFAATKLRGPTPTLIFWDETAWTEKGDVFWTSAQPSVRSTGGRAIFVSCVTDDTFIFTSKGIKQIKEFVKTNELGGHLIEDQFILGINKLRKSNIFFHNGYVDTLKIKTSFTELESSKNHKYWAFKNNKYDWFKAEELNVGDYVSLQYGMGVWGNNDNCSDFEPKESSHIKNIFKPTIITEDIAYLIGLYISEGYFRKIYYEKNQSGGQLVITCGDDISTILNKLSIKFNCSDGIHYIISSYNLLEFFEYLGFDFSKKAPQKTIPSRLLEMSRNNIVAMIQGIMDGDGYANFNNKKNKIRIGIGLSSKELINQLRIIFMNFGILTDYHEVLTKPTKIVKVESMNYRITATGEFAIKYFNEIGFRFNRKQIKLDSYDNTLLKHIGVNDNIPDGSIWANKIYKKEYGKLKIWKEEENFSVESLLWKSKDIIKSRKNILRLIDLEEKNISNNLRNEFNGIISKNIFWTKIKSIEKSKNYTYDFSMSNDNEIESNEFHQSIIYNGICNHQTPNGLDPVFYATFDKATRGENDFKAVELWWYNDPRYGKDLQWVKNEGKADQLVIKDDNFTFDRRKEFIANGFVPRSPWYEEAKRGYNGNLRKLAQEVECSFLGSGENFIAEEFVKRIEEKELRPPIAEEWDDKGMWIWEHPLPDTAYVISSDVSSGHGDDFSTVNVLKILELIEELPVLENGVVVKKKIKRRKEEQVAQYMGKLTPQHLAEIVYSYGVKYNKAYAVIDITGGLGLGTMEKLLEFGYPLKSIHYSEIQHKPTRDRLNNYVKSTQKEIAPGVYAKVDLIPGFMIGNNRAMVLHELERAVRMQDVIIRSRRTTAEFKTFQTLSGTRVAEAKRSFHDDDIFALAIGIYVISFDLFKNQSTTERTKAMLDSILVIGVNDNIQPDEIKKREAEDVRHHANPYGQHSWMFKNLKGS